MTAEDVFKQLKVGTLLVTNNPKDKKRQQILLVYEVTDKEIKLFSSGPLFPRHEATFTNCVDSTKYLMNHWMVL